MNMALAHAIIGVTRHLRSSHAVASSFAAMLAVVLVTLAGCAAPGGQSTRLTVGDLNYTVAELTQQLQTSPLITQRTPASPPMRVVIRRVENLTSDRITEAERWMVMARLRSGLGIAPLRDQKNIEFMIPPERQALARQGGFQGDLGPNDQPTHIMDAVFRSATRTGRDDKHGNVNIRSDFYFLEARVLDLSGRDVLWSGKAEFQREASGLVID